MRRKLGIGEGHVTLTDEAGLVVAVAVLLNALPVRRKAKSPVAPKAKAKAKAKAKPKSRAKSARKRARHSR